MKVTIDGLDEVVRHFTRAADEARPVGERNVVKAAAKAAQRMRDRVPIDSQHLLGTITEDEQATRDGRLIYAEAGPEAWYGRFPEEGTATQSPQPYASPAFDETAPEFERDMRDELFDAF